MRRTSAAVQWSATARCAAADAAAACSLLLLLLLLALFAAAAAAADASATMIYHNMANCICFCTVCYFTFLQMQYTQSIIIHYIKQESWQLLINTARLI